MSESRPNLRAAIERGDFILAPGVHDMMAAVIANKIGFDYVFASGYWLVASAYGLPDAGIATYTQMLDRMQTLARCLPASAIIADADTGYGGLLNVHHTVRGYEKAGMAAVQLEDQEFPKKCGHTPFKRCIAAQDMAAKIRVACDARQNPDTLIIARTDAKQAEGLERTLDRAQLYAQAGADIIFVEALESVEEMKEACARIKKPMMANMADGGRTPILSGDVLRDIGYQVAIYPAASALPAAAAIERALSGLKQHGTTQFPGADIFNFQEFNRLIGFEEVWAFERRWEDAGPAAGK